MPILALLATGIVGAEPERFALPDLERLFDVARAEVGEPLRIYSLAIASDGDTKLLVRRNDRPDLVDAFTLADGGIDGPIPVKFDRYPTLEALDYHEIDAYEVDASRLPQLVAAARARLKMPDAKLSGITLERRDSAGFPTYENAPIWELRLENARHDGYVQFDLHGRVLHGERE